MDMCAAGYQLSILEKLWKIQKETTYLTLRLKNGGRATDLDVTRARSALQQISATLPSLKAANRNAVYRLAMLTGHTPAEFTIKNCKMLPTLHSSLPIANGGVLLRRRPDIREAERMLASATAKIGVETANLYPDISFSGLAGTFGHLQDATKLSTFVSNVGPLISWTFPNISIARARIAQADAKTQAAFAKFDGVVLNALKEVESNLTTYTHDLDSVRDLKLAQRESRKAFLQSKLLYHHGRENFLSVLEAQKALTDVSSSLAIAESKVVTDQVNVFLSLGGGWDARV